MLLSFDTKNQIITRTDANRAIANSTDYFEVSVTFSANWNGYDKTICFKNGDTEINIMLVNNAVPKEAHLNLGVGTWKVSIIGIKGNHKILTNAVNLPVGASGYIGTTGPTPRVYEELLTIIQSLHTEVASEAALRSAVEQFIDENFHDIVISDVYSKSEIDSMILTKTVDDLVYYWNKSQTYNREEIEGLIEAAIQGRYIVVQTLPTTNINTRAIYLVPKESATVGDYYDEYINPTGTSAGWEHIGTTEIDLSNYYTKAEINALLDNKVDKVSGKGLSTNDYDNTAKSIVDGVTSALANKVDKETGKGLSTNDYDNTAKGIVDGVTAALAGKVDKETGKGLSSNDYDNTEKAKLAGISDGATKTESSLTNGHLEIDDVDVTVYDDSEIKQDLSTDTATVEGNPLNFTTLTAQKAKQTVISLEPIQDLHGYDHPWPAGGGKNKFNNQMASSTNQGVTFTKNDDGTVSVVGKCVDYDTAIASTNFSFAAGSYLYTSGITESFETIDTYLQVSGTTIARGNNATGFAFTLAADSTVTFIIRTRRNVQINELVKPMIRLATETDATFAPYSNYCPIDGRTETSLVGCGKNLISAIEANAYNSDGTTYTSDKRCRTPISFIKSGVYILQTNTTATGKTVQAMYETWKNDSYTSNEMLSESQYASEDQTITIESDTYISMVYKYSDNSIMSYTELKSQLELSPAATDYEPYTPSNNLTIQFGEKVYGATVELEKGTVTVDREIVDLGDLEWRNTEAVPNRFLARIDDIKLNNNTGLCSIYPITSVKGIDKSLYMADNYYGNNTIAVLDSSYSSATDFKTAMSGQQLIYELATPRTITITPNEISLLLGLNNISTDGDSITLTYRDGKVATLGDLDGLVKKITDCEDVEITDLQAGDVLVWDATAKKWKNQQSTSMVVYDDTEQVIGTWFGETLYQKTITYACENTSESQIAYTFSNGESVKNRSFYFINTLGETVSGLWYNLNFWDVIISTNQIMVKKESNDANWQTGVTFFITIQYTKTTPTLLMQSTPTEESTPANESESTDENR